MTPHRPGISQPSNFPPFTLHRGLRDVENQIWQQGGEYIDHAKDSLSHSWVDSPMAL